MRCPSRQRARALSAPHRYFPDQHALARAINLATSGPPCDTAAAGCSEASASCTDLRRLRELAVRSALKSNLRLRGVGLDLAAGSGKFTRDCRGARLCLVERAALLLGIRRHRLARARPPG